MKDSFHDHSVEKWFARMQQLAYTGRANTIDKNLLTGILKYTSRVEIWIDVGHSVPIASVPCQRKPTVDGKRVIIKQYMSNTLPDLRNNLNVRTIGASHFATCRVCHCPALKIELLSATDEDSALLQSIQDEVAQGSLLYDYSLFTDFFDLLSLSSTCC